MKSLKTFNLDKDVIDILASKHNKSQYVCRAVRRMSAGEEAFDLRELQTRSLLVALGLREDCPAAIRALIQDELYS